MQGYLQVTLELTDELLIQIGSAVSSLILNFSRDLSFVGNYD